jgi:diguanylate cyclase (GGDEF)-like protein
MAGIDKALETEDTQQTQEPGEKFGYIRSQYEPHRNSADSSLRESGMNEKTPGFRRVRRKFAEKLMNTSKEGEIDELTQLLNEKGFNRRLKQEAERANRTGNKSTVLYIDVNNLKLINDKNGHDAGNALLESVAQSILSATRITDVAARLHGDEFALILVGLDLESTKKLWDERFSKTLAEKSLSIAAGATEIDPNNPTESVKKADSAMYEAKSMIKEGIGPNEFATKNILVFHKEEPKAA